ncbi:hypothetical protein [Treponema sp.]|uniref:hypothetical protein n=1 Tax=Treponema sp. TaxID=166 RepID=UPI00257ECDC4|nr:hypothetical protein [Treponema sp.]
MKKKFLFVFLLAALIPAAMYAKNNVDYELLAKQGTEAEIRQAFKEKRVESKRKNEGRKNSADVRSPVFLRPKCNRPCFKVRDCFKAQPGRKSSAERQKRNGLVRLRKNES